MPSVVPFEKVPQTQQETVHFIAQMNANLQAISDLINNAHAVRPSLIFVEPDRLLLEYAQLNFQNIRDTLVAAGRPDIGQAISATTGPLDPNRLAELNAGLLAAVSAI